MFCVRWLAGITVAAVLLAGCVARPEPAPAALSTEPAPWAAPRDAISHIRAAGLRELPLDTDTDSFIVVLEVLVDGEPVVVPPHIGVDRLRAVQAPVHTHDASGDIWLEGEGNREVTLGEFFTLWGVAFDERCLGPYCGPLKVSADGDPVADPVDLVLRGRGRVVVSAQS